MNEKQLLELGRDRYAARFPEGCFDAALREARMGKRLARVDRDRFAAAYLSGPNATLIGFGGDDGQVEDQHVAACLRRSVIPGQELSANAVMSGINQNGRGIFLSGLHVEPGDITGHFGLMPHAWKEPH